MRRLHALGCSALLVAAGSCFYGWDDYRPPTTASAGQGGAGSSAGGGGAGCVGCGDWLAACAEGKGCDAAVTCPGHAQAASALKECACKQCFKDCPPMCGGAAEASDCLGCIAIDCPSQHASCSGEGSKAAGAGGAGCVSCAAWLRSCGPQPCPTGDLCAKAKERAEAVLSCACLECKAACGEACASPKDGCSTCIGETAKAACRSQVAACHSS
jgi:hypothetical protein